MLQIKKIELYLQEEYGIRFGVLLAERIVENSFNVSMRIVYTIYIME